MGLHLELQPGDEVVIGTATVRVGQKLNQRTRLTVDAPGQKITVNKQGCRSAAQLESRTHGKHPVRQRPATVS